MLVDFCTSNPRIFWTLSQRQKEIHILKNFFTYAHCKSLQALFIRVGFTASLPSFWLWLWFLKVKPGAY